MGGITWEKSDIEYLINNYLNTPIEDLSSFLKRTPNSIMSKATKLGLKRRVYTLESFNIKLALICPELQLVNFTSVKIKTEVKNLLCGHTWQVYPCHLLTGISIKCPTCNVSNRLKTTESFFSELLKKHPDTTVESVGAYLGSKEPLLLNYWCGHKDIVSTAGDLLIKGTKKVCRTCTPQKTNKKTNETFLEEFKLISGNDYTLLEEYNGDEEYLQVRHDPCGHMWKINPHNYLAKGTLSKCPNCFPYIPGSKEISSGESSLREHIESIYNGKIQYNNRAIINPLEVDILIPELNLAFEFNGTYWHSTNFKDKNYHLSKTNQLINKGYQLIHIHEYQWNTKQDIVKSRTASLLGQNTRVGARKCVIKTVDWHTAKIFLEQTHLQGGGSPTNINIALYYKDEIIALMTFGKPRYTKDCEYELIRYSQKLYHNVIGGASKLLNYFENEYLPDDIVSYANRDYSKGTLYENLGFKLSHISEPNYNYYKGPQRLSRYQTQKAKLEALVPQHWDPKLTESEIMQNAGYLKVYDSGNLVYKKTY